MSRSFSGRVAITSVLWTLGSVAAAVSFTTFHIEHGRQFVIPLHFSTAGFAAAILLVAAILHFRRSLSPFDQLRERLSAVRQGTAGQVTGEYPSEVQPLVDDLNGLLAHQAAAIARAQAKAGDLAHGLKTPLAVLQQDVDRAKAAGLDALAESIGQQVARMTRHVDWHLAHARAAASGGTATATANVAESVDGLARTLARVHAERTLSITSAVDAGVAVRVERVDLDEILGNLMDNACKWARTTVRVSVELKDGAARTVAVHVDDDGAGVAPDLRARVLARGVRADEQAPGTGLGLAIAQDLAALYDGAVTLGDSPLGGLRATVTLPRR